MGLAERMAQRKLRGHLSSGERILDMFAGTQPDGTNVGVFGGTCALYVLAGTQSSRALSVRRYPYTSVTTLAEGPGLDIILDQTEAVEIANRFSGFDGRMTDFVRARLLELPSYELRTCVRGDPWVIIFQPWRPDAAGSWLVHSPPGIEPNSPVQTELLNRAVHEIEATVVGRQFDSDAIIRTVPEDLPYPDFLKWWAHYFGLPDSHDVWWGLKADVQPASMMVFALRRDAVAVVDIDWTRTMHPFVRHYELNDVQIHKVNDHLFSIQLAGMTPHDAYFELPPDETHGHEWVRRVREAQTGPDPRSSGASSRLV